ncbi:hypothetical protein Pmani_038049 [Petrolisthes manimaculis]|uniref:Uncharacterized protein n=1 Tax=Petrolisthes manimaculis TaxID=1843537 RepID=A0AAE1NGL0_9EUCA|nr:hypothetical protein Pmani_038049 [Petrolisthes manimaculis]
MSSLFHYTLLILGLLGFVVIGQEELQCYWETATRSGSTAEVVVYKNLTDRKVGIWKRPDNSWIAGSIVIECSGTRYTILDSNRNTGNLPVFNRTSTIPKKGECGVVYYSPSRVSSASPKPIRTSSSKEMLGRLHKAVKTMLTKVGNHKVVCGRQ